ncbi:hypothetical protein ELUCI_v1c04860 [Williamsoniiplasma lucivorax]|uniref:Uncharacterized protein n=1 Tax=Williamsoniiplasma lucivorax TaxID=209274 RepID=A0A2S5RDL2_9MOLU|nr:hypothetical protein ELUCI_v1c04860 [Williamsoniiplasma lucivorax]
MGFILFGLKRLFDKFIKQISESIGVKNPTSRFRRKKNKE